MSNRLTFESPAKHDDPAVMSREEIAAILVANPKQWAVVARHDRAARAATHVERILSGREYGEGFDSVGRRVGNEHRVYARKR